jgi:rRNA-processing protein EBP2
MSFIYIKYQDAKYGFGGKKRGNKRNNRESDADMSGYGKSNSKKPFGAGGKGKKPAQRPGKNKRQKMRN